MNFSLFIARRYFKLSPSKNLIQRIGFISFLSMAISTMSLLLVLSVFNGLETFIKSLFLSFDPDIKITLKKGKKFTLDSNLRYQITNLPGVSKVVEILEDNALIQYQERQIIVKIKGVSEEFFAKNRLARFIQQGNFRLKDNEEYLAIVGSGIQYALSISLTDPCHMLQVFYPKNITNSTTFSNKLYTCKSIKPGAIFTVEKQFDENYVIVPIEFAAMLMNIHDTQRTALEIQVEKGYSINQVQQQLKKKIPDTFQVLNSNEQQSMLMKTIHIERLFVFGTFAFILFFASLNIFFILSMLVLEKRKDIAVLYSLGVNTQTIQYIFLIQGGLIALSGAVIGMITAWGLAWLQQKFSLVSLGVETSLLTAYPIAIKVSDFVYTILGVVLITFMAAYRPAQLAAKTKIKNIA